MRTIKFRGKSLFKNEWVFGYFKKNAHGDCYIEDENGLTVLVDPDTVSQMVYISEEGKEVYEGDYVRVDSDFQKNGLYLVEWDSEQLAYKAIPQEDSLKYWEVGYPSPVGNIWDTEIDDLYEED